MISTFFFGVIVGFIAGSLVERLYNKPGPPSLPG